MCRWITFFCYLKLICYEGTNVKFSAKTQFSFNTCLLLCLATQISIIFEIYHFSWNHWCMNYYCFFYTHMCVFDMTFNQAEGIFSWIFVIEFQIEKSWFISGYFHTDDSQSRSSKFILGNGRLLVKWLGSLNAKI